MPLIPSPLGYHLLRLISRLRGDVERRETAYAATGKAGKLLGPWLMSEVPGRVVVDFGCGEGRQTLELLAAGAASVLGVDIRPEMLQVGMRNAAEANAADRVRFSTSIDVPADVIVSLDSFEHFADPEAVLAAMYRGLKPGGRVVAAFGPTWYHPLGGHLFSVFPYAHLVLAEACLLRWRRDHRDDGATRFAEVSGGLNQMTIGRFESMVRRSGFDVRLLEAVPIRRLRWVAAPWNREFTTAVVRAILEKPPSPRATPGGTA